MGLCLISVYPNKAQGFIPRCDPSDSRLRESINVTLPYCNFLNKKITTERVVACGGVDVEVQGALQGLHARLKSRQDIHGHDMSCPTSTRNENVDVQCRAEAEAEARSRVSPPSAACPTTSRSCPHRACTWMAIVPFELARAEHRHGVTLSPNASPNLTAMWPSPPCPMTPRAASSERTR